MRKIIVSLFVMMSFAAYAADKPRVFVTDSTSWEMQGGGGGSSSGFGGATTGGARPQTAEIIKTFGQRCPEVVINNKKEKADYTVVLEHEGGKGLLKKDNKVAVFNHDGDSILSRSTRSLGNSVQDACGAIAKDWVSKSAAGPTAASESSASEPKLVEAVQTTSTAAGANVAINSEPVGADIEVDGAFLGNTPSAVQITAGEHMISVNKRGFKPWQRKIRTMNGNITVNAELEKKQ